MLMLVPALPMLPPGMVDVEEHAPPGGDLLADLRDAAQEALVASQASERVAKRLRAYTIADDGEYPGRA